MDYSITPKVTPKETIVDINVHWFWNRKGSLDEFRHEFKRRVALEYPGCRVWVDETEIQDAYSEYCSEWENRPDGFEEQF